MKIDDSDFVKYYLWFLTHDGDWLEEYAEIIDPTLFETKEVQYITDVALRYWRDRGEPIPFKQMGPVYLDDEADSLRLKPENVMEMYGTAKKPMRSARAGLFDYTRIWFRTRLFQNRLEEAASLSEDNRLEEAISLLRDGVDDDAFGKDQNRPTGILANLDENLQSIKRLYSVEFDSTAISTGLRHLDEIMRGGIRPAEFGVILAPSNRGKSHMLISLACQGLLVAKRVLFLTLEMSTDRVNQRIYANLSDVPADLIMQELETVSQRIRQRCKSGVDIDVIKYAAEELGVTDVRQKIRAAEKVGNPYDLVVIDYADLMRAEKTRSERRVDEAKEIYQGLFTTAHMLDIPIWTASQANRAAFTKPVIGLDHTGDSIDKIRTADWVIAMNQSQDEKNNNEMRLSFVKARNTELGFCQVEYDFSRSKFVEIVG